MKKSISVWSFPFEWPLEKKLSLAREAGFDGFEIEMTEEGPVNLKSSVEELSQVRSLAEKYQIKLSGLATGLYWGANGASADSAIRSKAAHILQRQIETAQALGIDTILVIPATVGADFIPNCEIVPYETALRYAQELIRKALPLAEKNKVTIAIENVWNKFLLSPLEMRSFIDGFSSPNVGSYFDVGNVLATGYPEDWINLLGSRIKRVHFKDYRRNVGTTDGFVELLSGDLNWPAVAKALKTTGYNSWCAAELIPPVPFYKHSPETVIFNTSRAMEAIFAMA